MVEIKHLETVSLNNGTSRLFFKIEEKDFETSHAELILDLRWIFGSLHKESVGDYHMKKGSKEIVHIDINTKIAKRFSRFRWELIGFVCFKGRFDTREGKGKKA